MFLKIAEKHYRFGAYTSYSFSRELYLTTELFLYLLLSTYDDFRKVFNECVRTNESVFVCVLGSEVLLGSNQLRFIEFLFNRAWPTMCIIYMAIVGNSLPGERYLYICNF